MFRSFRVPGLLLAATCTALPRLEAQRPQVQRLLSDHRYEWITLAADSLKIHFPVASYADANRSTLRERVEASMRAVLDRLSETDYRTTLDLFYVDSRDDMANLTGYSVTGYTYFKESAVVVVFNAGWRSLERHEMAHAVTLGTWPEPHGIAVVEGVATFVDGECGGYDNGRVLRTILERGELIPLEVLEGDFRRQNDLIAYLEAAGVVEFMVSKVGPGVVRQLWNGGIGSSPTLLDTPIDKFRADFRDWLTSAYDPIPGASWKAIRVGGCGINVRSAGHEWLPPTGSSGGPPEN